ncbi:MAG: GDP-mannose 4,6-dehydratase [Hyphomicrobium sp.]|nr:GDP-mannose 4,6-dehydratase [Hyphomicrobium sp.]
MTGGAGFGGSHLCIELLKRGAHVYLLDRIVPRNSYLQLSGFVSDVQIVLGDVRNLDLLKTLIERFRIDVIFHLAAQPLVGPSNVLPLETLDINISGTYSVLEAMRTTDSCKFMVFASSGGHYGATTRDFPISEEDIPAPASNIYGASKSAADVIVRAYAQVYGLNVAACRFMNTYGPGDTNFSRLIPRAIRNLIEQSSYSFGDRDDGSTRLDFLFIRDMTQAYISVAENLEEVKGEAFNFGSGASRSTAEVAKLVSIAFDGKDRCPEFSGPSRAVPIVKYLDISKAEARLGWKPSTALHDGLRETLEWYRRHGVTF